MVRGPLPFAWMQVVPMAQGRIAASWVAWVAAQQNPSSSASMATWAWDSRASTAALV